MDNATMKANQHQTWTSVAPGWRKHDARITELSQSVTSEMIANLKPGDRVLDIACGTGTPAIQAAERVGPAGKVTATDFVEEMLTYAREKASAKGLSNIEFSRVDGESLKVSPGYYDAATMRWGLMFMPNPAKCLSRVFPSLKRGGEIVLTCWAGPEKNPWASIPIAVLKRHMEVPTPPPGAPGLFAFADPAHLKKTLEDAGFYKVSVEEHSLVMSEFDTGAAYVDFTLELAGPIAMLFSQLPAEKVPTVRREIEVEAEKSNNGRVRLTGLTWIARGRA